MPARARLCGCTIPRPVEFTWNAEGSQLFREFTGEHIQERLAAIIDGAVVTAPVIQTRIGRRGTISGDFSQQEAAGNITRIEQWLRERKAGGS